MDKSYPKHEQTKQWVEQISESKSNASFDDTGSAWNSAPSYALEIAEAIDQAGSAKTLGYASGRALVAATMDAACKSYEEAHGRKPSGGILDSALRTALNGISPSALRHAGVDVAMDSVTSSQSGAPMVANRAMIAMHQSVVEALPFAGVIPMEDGLQGKIIIAGHSASNAVGDYAANETLDGIYGGKSFMSASRVVEATSSDQTTYTAKILHAKGDTDGSPVLPSGTDVFVNGIPAGGAAVSARATDSVVPLAGNAMVGDKDVSFTGTLKPLTGEVSIKFAEALPSAASVQVSSILNFEHEKLKDKRPRVMATADVYDFRATFMSAYYQVTQEAKAQFASEVRLDAGSEAMLAMRQQSAFERHIEALRRMYGVGKNFKTTINLNTPTRQDERTRASVWQDVLFALTDADQKMVERTNAFGIGVLYVGGKGAAELSALPDNMFVSSGISSRTGIYRLGRLFGKYDVYYAPHIVSESTNALEILAIGRSEQTGLNPYIVGDVVAPTFLKLAVNSDLSEGAGYFQAGAARINPYRKAALGAAVIAITGL